MILALQCCPVDSAQAIELTRLICDIEPRQRADEFCIAARKDTSRDHIKAMFDLAQQKFAAVHVVEGQRAGVGWPEGPNDLWAETMMRVSLLAKNHRTQQKAVLTFEADCVPLRADWIDVLNEAWIAADRRGRDVVGHAHGEPPDHINGNAIFRIGLVKKYPTLNNAHRRKGWDHFHGELLLKLGEDTDLIFQVYNLRDYDREFIEGIRKNEVVPALFHGAKGMAGIRAVRAMLEDNTLTMRSGGEVGSVRAYKYTRPEAPLPTSPAEVKPAEAPPAEPPAPAAQPEPEPVLPSGEESEPEKILPRRKRKS